MDGSMHNMDPIYHVVAGPNVRGICKTKYTKHLQFRVDVIANFLMFMNILQVCYSHMSDSSHQFIT
jgi:hypothetical protein